MYWLLLDPSSTLAVLDSHEHNPSLAGHSLHKENPLNKGFILLALTKSQLDLRVSTFYIQFDWLKPSSLNHQNPWPLPVNLHLDPGVPPIVQLEGLHIVDPLPQDTC